MTARLPTPGGDDGTWGDILNSFLEVSHNSDGTLSGNAITQAGGLTTSQLGQPSGVASLNSSGLIPTAQLGSGSASSSNFLRGDGTWVVPNSGSSTLAADTDVSINSPSNTQVLTYNGTKWVNDNLTEGSIPNLISDLGNRVELGGDIGGTTTAPTLEATSNVESIIADNPTVAGAIQSSVIGQPNGVAGLDSGGLVPVTQLPVASQALLLMGAGTPSSLLGLNGDYYKDITTGYVYGPKASGSWPTPTLDLAQSVGTVIATSTTITVPSGVGLARITSVGGGGGGGGGGSALTSGGVATQVGGGGGGGGAATQAVAAVTAGLVLTVTIGSGGSGNSGGTANGNAGTAGINGSSTTVTGTGVSVTGYGGGGGNGGGANSTTSAASGLYGGQSNTAHNVNSPPPLGCGSPALTTGAVPGGAAAGSSGSGGTGGGAANTTNGGVGGGAGGINGVISGATGAGGSSTSSGGNGSNAPANSGSGGGGGGGGAPGGSGGTGGNGGSGWVLIEWIG